MKTKRKIIAGIISVIVIGGILFALNLMSNRLHSGKTFEATGNDFKDVALTKEYKNEEYNFSLKIPEDFTAHELENDSGKVVTIEDGKGNGIQIIISPFDDIKDLTEQMIREQIPDMKITDVQPIDIGNDYKGIAFISDSDVFGGASREVWFVFNKNLYQISTYAKLDNLLQAIFSTWNFF